VTLHGGLPILLLEDDADDAHFVRRALQRAHIVNPVIEFSTARSARRHFADPSAESPVLVISDVNLPGGETGIDFLRWLRKQRSPLESTPAMMLTGSEREDDRSEAESLGSIYFLRKPVTEERLTTAVQSLGFVISSLTGVTTQRTIHRRD
jgi:DNA-binding response OmpR family regulator